MQSKLLFRLCSSTLGSFGIFILSLILVFVFILPFFTPYSQETVFYIVDGVEYKSSDGESFENGQILTKSKISQNHPLGTDRDGRDVLTRLMYGGRVSLIISVCVTVLRLLIGLVVGILAGYIGGIVDFLLMSFVDIIACLPDIPIMLIIASFTMNLHLEQFEKLILLIIVLSALSWTNTARLIRGQVLEIKKKDYITSCYANGFGLARVIFKHILPSLFPILALMGTLSIGSVILMESALSFLGLSVSFPYASWGNMLCAASDPIILKNNLNIWLPPGVMIFLTVIAFNFIGDALRTCLKSNRNKG